MDCDQVFIILTSGPFPTGEASDAEVEDHLERCPDCWKIAEALRPAHDVFEESIPASEGHDLPGYWGDSLPARTVMSQLQQTALRSTAIADREKTVSLQKPRTLAWSDLAIVGGFVLVIGGLAFLVAWLLQLSKEYLA